MIWHIIGAEKLTDDYFGRLSFNTGVSQRRRAVLHDRLTALYVGEAAKWCATAVLAAFYLFTLRPQKGLKLVEMRIGITRGIMKKE